MHNKKAGRSLETAYMKLGAWIVERKHAKNANNFSQNILLLDFSLFFFSPSFFFSSIPQISSTKQTKSLGKDGIEVFAVTKKSNLTERCFGPGRWAEIVNNDFPEIGQTSLESKHFHRLNWFNSRICMIRVGTSVIYCLPLQFWSCSIPCAFFISGFRWNWIFLFSLDIDVVIDNQIINNL